MNAGLVSVTCGYVTGMSDSDPTSEDPAVVGVPPDVPDGVRPSATGVVPGPVEGDPDVEVADVRVDDDG